MDGLLVLLLETLSYRLVVGEGKLILKESFGDDICVSVIMELDGVEVGMTQWMGLQMEELR